LKLAVVGTGYVGVVTGVTLSEIGHHVTCIDIDETKIEKIRKGISPIYEPGLSELMKKNIEAGRLAFTSNHKEGFNEADVIYIAVGTPENEDGSANLTFVEEVATTIALTAKKDTIVVTKSTVPVGTNDRLRQIIDHNKLYHINIEVVSNPEFLKEEYSIYDSFYGDGIVSGASSEEEAKIIEEVNRSFGIPINDEYAFLGKKALKPNFPVSLGSWCG
jgi:UDPglucose 6-dehydrogenase